MGINLLGLVAAVSTFTGVWLGHVFVRKIERASENLLFPVLSALSLGLAMLVFSLLAPARMVSTALGILSVTVLWDALEFVRQEKRVKKGHAPANPKNPRHIRIMRDFPSATVENVLSMSSQQMPEKESA